MSEHDPTPATNGSPGKAKKPVDPARVEHMTSQLKTSAQRRRPQRLVLFFGALLLCALPIGLIVWVFWPRQPPPEVQVVAFDELYAGAPDKFQVRAQLIVADGQTGTIDFPGCEVFVSQEMPAGGQKPVSAPPDREGVIVCPWPAPPPGEMALFRVIYSDVARKKTPDDRARVWVVPERGKILLVDVHALTPSAADFRKAGVLRDLPASPAAAPALRKARAAGYVIAYLASAGDDARRYARVRAWVMGHGFPEGPVLHRAGGGETESEQEAYRATVTALRQAGVEVTAVLRTDAADVGALPDAVPVVDPERDWPPLEKRWGK
jgi:hypothetical protein